jgi:hypothetical protein
MPRYYFHVGRGQITLLDHEGIELADTVESLNGQSAAVASTTELAVAC